jgi:hypothetical protein
MANKYDRPGQHRPSAPAGVTVFGGTAPNTLAVTANFAVVTGSGLTGSLEASLRAMAKTIFTAVNEQGGTSNKAGHHSLGQQQGHTITLDINAAGWGWFVDPTPRDDSEITTAGNQGEQHHMDLLTVLEHELGHILGS